MSDPVITREQCNKLNERRRAIHDACVDFLTGFYGRFHNQEYDSPEDLRASIDEVLVALDDYAAAFNAAFYAERLWETVGTLDAKCFKQ